MKDLEATGGKFFAKLGVDKDADPLKAARAKSPDPGLTDLDRKVSENMMGMWAQFARTGNPNVEGLVPWPAYEPSTDQYLYIAEPVQVKSGFSKVAQKP